MLQSCQARGERALLQSLSGLKIAIADPQSLTQLPANQVGEIWISASSLTKLAVISHKPTINLNRGVKS